MPKNALGIRFANGPKIHYVTIDEQSLAHVGDLPPLHTTHVHYCVVNCRRGLEIAQLRSHVVELADEDITIGNFVRLASAQDMAKHQQCLDKAEDLKWLMRSRTREDRVKVKIVSLELDLEEKNLIVNYFAENQVQLRPYLEVLAAYTNARIEFRSVGARDQVRIVGALGACGDGSCSSTWMQSFHSVSIKMARDQQLPLNSDKISGPCGRLMCCLAYEHPMYDEFLKGMPRRGMKMCSKKHGTCGTIGKIFPLKQTVELHHKKGREEVSVDDVLSPEEFALLNAAE